MNLNELFLGSIAAGPDSSALPQAARQANVGSKSFATFKQMLDSRMSEASPSKSVLTWSAVTGRTDMHKPADDVKAEQEPLYKSYRQLTNSSRRQTVRTEAKRSVSDIADDCSVISENSKKRAKTSEGILEMLAFILGVDRSRLEALLKENGISAEDLINSEGIEDVAVKLSELFGLGEDQSEALSEMLKIIRDLVVQQTTGQQTTPVLYNEEIADSEPVRTEISGTEAAYLSRGTDLAPELAEQLREHIQQKLGEFAEKLEDGQDGLRNDIIEAFREMNGRIESLKQSVINPDISEDGSMDAADTDPDTQKNALSVRKAEHAQTDESEQKITGDADRQAITQQTQSIGDEVQQPAEFQLINANVYDQAKAEMIETTERQVIQPREIISQIVEKAAVVVGQDRSEMVMELKPESLGRISLKVATENGIVMAKFVAESRQVQQILESNMQMLKDSLARQGINVQSLSVSVRQDGEQNGEYRPTHKSTMRSGGRRTSANAAARSSIIGAIAGISAERNPYMWDNSTINVTA